MGSDPMDEFDTHMKENANFYPLFTHNYALLLAISSMGSDPMDENPFFSCSVLYHILHAFVNLYLCVIRNGTAYYRCIY